MILGVLDQSPIRSGASPADAIQETLVLAEHADRLGYSRYWLAEHHSSGGLAGTAPEVLIGQVAARTSRIRVGSGGVMLSHYSPLKVAESFRVLEALFPGRIDLGIGRAPGSDQRTARALRYGPGGVPLEHFPQQLADLIGFLHDELPAGHPFQGVRAMPAGPTAPPLWILGSSGDGAALAAHFGTAFSFAHFINAVGGVEATQAYREAAYHISKTGLQVFKNTLALELAPFGIRVNLLVPGHFPTGLTAGVSEQTERIMRGQIPLRRLGRTSELGPAAVLLLSDQLSPYTTGAEIAVDGGLHLRPLPLWSDDELKAMNLPE